MPVTSRRSVEIRPLTPDRWRDLAALFETNAVTRGCWCMWFRLRTPDFRANEGDGNRRAFQRIVRSAAVPPGLIAYLDGAPAGWCAVAPRDDYPRILRSPTTKPLDDRPAWAVTCFFIARHARGAGLMRRLLDEAVRFAADHGATLVEGYPVDPGGRRINPDEAYHGLASVFAAAGFEEAARRQPKRPIMRRALAPSRRAR